eukprot:753410-Hanusia_phi.AAC.6
MNPHPPHSQSHRVTRPGGTTVLIETVTSELSPGPGATQLPQRVWAATELTCRELAHILRLSITSQLSQSVTVRTTWQPRSRVQRPSCRELPLIGLSEVICLLRHYPIFISVVTVQMDLDLQRRVLQDRGVASSQLNREGGSKDLTALR